MSTYTLHVDTHDPKTALRGKRTVGGAKNLEVAQANAGKALERNPDATEVVISGPVDDAGTVGEIGRVSRD